MDKAKEVIEKATGNDNNPPHFQEGHKIPIAHQSIPGKQHKLQGPTPINDQLPTPDGQGYQLYRAAGKLQNKKALITGGDSGIGRAIAILYAMEGAESAIVYKPEEERDARDTVELVKEKGGYLHLIPADLREPDECRKAVRDAVACMGGIDVLVLNHGTQVMKEDIEDVDEDQWHNTFNTNIHSFYYLTRSTLPHLSPGSTIITCASINPFIGRPDLLDYTTTKGAIVSFTRALSNQQLQKKSGIRVNAVCPGPIWTPLIPATMNERAQKEFTSPMGRPGQPSEVATAFVWLASMDSSFVSGQCLHVNGGTVVGS